MKTFALVLCTMIFNANTHAATQLTPDFNGHYAVQVPAGPDTDHCHDYKNGLSFTLASDLKQASLAITGPNDLVFENIDGGQETEKNGSWMESTLEGLVLAQHIHGCDDQGNCIEMINELDFSEANLQKSVVLKFILVGSKSVECTFVKK